MKKKLLLGVVCVGLLGTACYSTVAYFVADTRTTNIITMPSLDLDLEEMMQSGTGLIKYPVDTIKDVMPGRTISKIPYINNDGKEDFYTRVYIKTHIYDPDGVEIFPEEEIVRLNIDKEKWITDSENVENQNWYYYTEIVKAGENKVIAPFTEVTFSKDMGNAYKNIRVEIDVYAQAVQVKNNEIDTNSQTTLDVKGWPVFEMAEVSK